MTPRTNHGGILESTPWPGLANRADKIEMPGLVLASVCKTCYGSGFTESAAWAAWRVVAGNPQSEEIPPPPPKELRTMDCAVCNGFGVRLTQSGMILWQFMKHLVGVPQDAPINVEVDDAAQEA